MKCSCGNLMILDETVLVCDHCDFGCEEARCPECAAYIKGQARKSIP